MKLRLAVVAAVLAVAACSSQTTTTEPVVYSLAQAADSVQIRVGETISVEGTRIQFESVVSDSRCPMDVVCVWEGDAAVQISAQQGADTQLMQLHTTLEPHNSTAHGYRIELRSVSPYPRAATPTRPDSYSVWLRIVRVP
jgi:hypothetical protein